MNEHTQKIKQENRSLRHELLLLIRKTRALHEHRNHLEDQQSQLMMEQQYARDLKTLRSARQHKVNSIQMYHILTRKRVCRSIVKVAF